MKLDGADLATALGGTGLSGTGDVSTALSASGKSVGGLVATLSGSGTAAFRSLVIAGVNPLALPQFIARADAVRQGHRRGKDRKLRARDRRVGQLLRPRRPKPPSRSPAACCARRRSALENTAASIEADLQADFNTGQIAADGTITYRPGDEALVGSEPALRFSLDGPLGATTGSSTASRWRSS